MERPLSLGIAWVNNDRQANSEPMVLGFFSGTYLSGGLGVHTAPDHINRVLASNKSDCMFGVVYLLGGPAFSHA